MTDPDELDTARARGTIPPACADHAELRALCERATPGPWGATPSGTVDNWPGGPETQPDELVEWVPNQHHARRVVDAAFIAAARTAVPQLLEECARLRQERDALRAAAAELFAAGECWCLGRGRCRACVAGEALARLARKDGGA